MKSKLLLLLAAPLLLTGCKAGGSSEAPASSSASESSSSSSESSSSEPGSQYTALGIMQDIGTAAWGYTEDGDFQDPDAEGVVESNYTIGWEADDPADSEECLNGVLNELFEILPSYLSIVQGPTYTANAITSVTPALGVSELYTITDDEEFVAYFYNYFYNDSISIVFMCGPTSAFLE